MPTPGLKLNTFCGFWAGRRNGATPGVGPPRACPFLGGPRRAEIGIPRDRLGCDFRRLRAVYDKAWLTRPVPFVVCAMTTTPRRFAGIASDWTEYYHWPKHTLALRGGCACRVRIVSGWLPAGPWNQGGPLYRRRRHQRSLAPRETTNSQWELSSSRIQGPELSRWEPTLSKRDGEAGAHRC